MLINLILHMKTVQAFFFQKVPLKIMQTSSIIFKISNYFFPNCSKTVIQFKVNDKIIEANNGR